MKYLGINIDVTRDSNFSEQGLTLLERYYTSEGREGVQRAIARVANCFSFGDVAFAQRIYDQISKHHWYPSSPIFSNAVEGEWLKPVSFGDNTSDVLASWGGPKPKAMPIACFLAYLEDSIKGQIETASEISLLSVMGGGTAVHSAIRATSDKAPGPVPYIKTLDGIMGYYRQGKTRRGSTAVYLEVSHPDVEEFIRMRHPSGGDPARKIDNRKGVHIAVNITEAFVEAVDKDLDWNLVDPHSGNVHKVLKARALWEAMLDARELTGEPFFYFIDVAQAALPYAQQKLGLKTNGSNLCTEITLATSPERTAVCCLSSLNLDRYEEWKDTSVVEDMVRFLDNVLEWFITFAPNGLRRAVLSAKSERAIGIGFMGWHYYLMKNKIPYESGGFNSALQHLHIIHGSCYDKARSASKRLGEIRGIPEDMRGTVYRNSHIFAIAPNVNSAVLCNTCPSVEPLNSNAYTQKSRAGVTLVKNKYLQEWLDKYQEEQFDYYHSIGERYQFIDEDAFWNDIVAHNGSVQHLDFMSPQDKEIFKTAWEIDQHWVIEHAENRQPYICQAASTNLFFLPGSDRAYINSVHLKAARGRTVKSLYYYRTGSAAAVDTVRTVTRKSLEDWKGTGDECVSCQG